MKNGTQTIVQEVDKLKVEFGRRGLDLASVWQSTPDDPERDYRLLASLLLWADAYAACPDRDKLEAQGFLYPPVEPDCDPDTDWVRFERWMRKQPTEWRHQELLGELPAADDLSDQAVVEDVQRITEALASRNVVVALNEQLPPRLAYGYLKHLVETTSFEFLGPDTHMHVDGCDGYCPDCLQRPWCDMGEEEWPEDIEAGRMVMPEAAARYVAHDRSVRREA